MPDIHSKPNNFKLNISVSVCACSEIESRPQGLLSEVLSAAAGVSRDKTMDFDEYEYLEKTVENPELEKVKEVTNGSEERDRDRRRSSKHRSDDNEHDADHSLKRSKSSGEKSHDHELHGSRHRSRSRDGERDRHKSNREHRDKEREREKDRDREERNGTAKGRNRDRDRDGDRDLDRSFRDRDSERRRGREKERESRSRSDKRQGDRDETDRERGRDKEREKDREKPLKERERDHRRHKDKKEEEPEADPERDQRTVFAYQINLKADERDVYEFFSRAGKVRDVRLIMDRISRRSKGVGYIEFYDAMSVPMAIALSGPYSGGARRLYVGNLHSNLTSDQLKKIFEPFGEVELVQLPLDETGNCKGFGFVQFVRLEDARNALSLNGLEIAGRTIKVSAVTDQPGTQDVAPTSGDFDDDDGGGLSLNASSRAMLMKKLDRSGTVASITGVNDATAVLPSGPTVGTLPVVPLAVAPLMQSAVPSLGGLPFTGLQVPPAAVPTINSIGIPSECLLLKNMFDPTLETEPDFDLDIKDDVQEESSKYGKLKHIYVDKNSAGFVYLRFENAQSAISAQRALHEEVLAPVYFYLLHGFLEVSQSNGKAKFYVDTTY
ncbi:hypothetical protein CDL15_Pgr019718 [Punica granatum]|uniref:RRM domain-containing protein n=1 Tax=Punica granatum TaxID=22663 RepID=A0A218X6P8_PUNGR|nr:hypothetical protein CDL15_Pgr019718 [Punica granatum]